MDTAHKPSMYSCLGVQSADKFFLGASLGGCIFKNDLVGSWSLPVKRARYQLVGVNLSHCLDDHSVEGLQSTKLLVIAQRHLLERYEMLSENKRLHRIEQVCRRSLASPGRSGACSIDSTKTEYSVSKSSERVGIRMEEDHELSGIIHPVYSVIACILSQILVA